MALLAVLSPLVKWYAANSPSPHRPAPARSASAQPAAGVLYACCTRDVSKGLRRGLEGVSKGLRRDSVVFPPFFLPSLLPAHPPCHPQFLLPCTLIDPAAPKRLHPFCGADTAPAVPELAIQSASQPGTNFPDEPIIPAMPTSLPPSRPTATLLQKPTPTVPADALGLPSPTLSL
jgi:hypothetical protein